MAPQPIKIAQNGLGLSGRADAPPRESRETQNDAKSLKTNNREKRRNENEAKPLKTNNPAK
jgi:hypothetical protein